MKFSGSIGFWLPETEVSPGVWKPTIVEKPYAGDVIRNYRNAQNQNSQNDDLVLNNQISILSDLYLRDNWDSIRYVLWNGVRWKVTSVEINYPRVILQVGGVYNGATQEPAITS